MEKNIGELIGNALKDKGISKAEFARKINTSRQNVNNILGRSNIDVNLLFTISEALGVNIFDEVIKGSKLENNKSLLKDEARAFIQIEFSAEKRDKIMKLVDTLEILK